MVRIGRYVARLARILFTGSAFFVFWWGGAFLTRVVLPIIRFRHRRQPTEARRRCRHLLHRRLRPPPHHLRFFPLLAVESPAAAPPLPIGPLGLVPHQPALTHP